MIPAYTTKLGFTLRLINIDAQKIVGLPLKTHEMIIAGFSMVDKLGQIRFFKETFLLADTSMEVVLGMLFLFFSNANVEFVKLSTLI